MTRLTEQELVEHYSEYELDYVANIPHLTRLQLEVGIWYPYNAIKHFGDVSPSKNKMDELATKLGLPEYPPLVFCYNGGEHPWTQAIDDKIMYVDRYKNMCYHEEEYAEHGLDWLQGADNQMGEVLCLIRRIYRTIDVDNYKAIDYLKEIENNIHYRRMCYDGAMDYIMENMEDKAHQFENDCYESANRRTPCDYPDNDGHYNCPFDAQGGDDCRNYCGLGVDE